MFVQRYEWYCCTSNKTIQIPSAVTHDFRIVQWCSCLQTSQLYCANCILKILLYLRNQQISGWLKLITKFEIFYRYSVQYINVNYLVVIKFILCPEIYIITVWRTLAQTRDDSTINSQYPSYIILLINKWKQFILDAVLVCVFWSHLCSSVSIAVLRVLGWSVELYSLSPCSSLFLCHSSPSGLRKETMTSHTMKWVYLIHCSQISARPSLYSCWQEISNSNAFLNIIIEMKVIFTVVK